MTLVTKEVNTRQRQEWGWRHMGIYIYTHMFNHESTVPRTLGGEFGFEKYWRHSGDFSLAEILLSVRNKLL